MTQAEQKSSLKSAIDKHKEFLFPAVATYYQEPLALVKGEGAHVWDDNHDPGSNAIDVCVTRLRRKVDSGREPLIHTRRGAGYLLAQLDEE